MGISRVVERMILRGPVVVEGTGVGDTVAGGNGAEDFR